MALDGGSRVTDFPSKVNYSLLYQTLLNTDGLWSKSHCRSTRVPHDIFLFSDIFICRFVRNLGEVWPGNSFDEMFLLELDVGQILGRSGHSRDVPLASVSLYKGKREKQLNTYITELSFGPM